MRALMLSLLRHPAAPAPAPLDLSVLLGAQAWGRLPAAVQRRFGATHPDTSYRGELTFRCSTVGRLFAWMSRAFGSPLTPLRADGVAATVCVQRNGRGGVVWERHFNNGSQQTHTVRSTKELHGDAQLYERTDGGLSMSLDVFEEDGSLVFCSRKFFLCWGGWHVPVPSLLSPGVCRVTHTDLGAGLFRFTLSMVHPIWGETFHQSGVFADPLETQA
jgi:Domain of unknown function (DUF4166)